ncbi:MAG: prepilin-type N-terminal cleavage/methylation domain-containing protein [Azoarcus sp.]|jgi:type IV pilus assembly protein PilW|nr:prepilin-type N-terminal cleavage/methylation domain-containing protein [Azoarcus sp.]
MGRRFPSPCFPLHRRAGQTGMTLVELMVSMALGLIVVAAAISIFLASREANRDTESLSRIQENARIAFDLMHRSMREVGGIPCGAGASSITYAVPPGAEWYATAGASYEALALEGKTDDGIGGASAQIQRPDGGNYTVEYASGSGDSVRLLTFSSDTGGGGLSPIIAQSGNTLTLQSIDGFDPNGIFLACDQSKGSIFTGGRFSASPTASMPERGTFIATHFDPVAFGLTTIGAYLAMLHPEVWFIGKNERGGRSLYRVADSGADEIAPDAVNMRIEYLVPGAAAYADAGKIAADDWPKVVAIRIVLTLRSDSTRSATAPGVIERTLAHTVTLRSRQPVQALPPP